MKQPSLFAAQPEPEIDREADMRAVLAGERVHGPLWELFEVMRGKQKPYRTNPSDLAMYREWINAAWKDYFREIREQDEDTPGLRACEFSGYCSWLRARTCEGWNTRYVLFARSQGRDPKAQREHDREEWPPSPTIPFGRWIGEMWATFFEERGEQAPRGISDKTSEAFDRWLEAKYPANESKVTA